MGSSSKTRTTYAKLNRESKLREKRAEKEARKAARKQDATGETTGYGSWPEEFGSAAVDAEAITVDSPQAGPAGGSPAGPDEGT